MEITFTMTPEQQAADDARAKAFQQGQEARARQTAAELSPAAYQAARAALTRPQPRQAPAAGAHVSTLTPEQYTRELRRLGASRPR